MNTRMLIQKSIRTAVCACASICITAGSTAVFSAEPYWQQKVSYGDLNLNRPEGIAALYRRLRAAADEVCQPAGAGDLVSEMHSRQCEAEAIGQAIAKIDVPGLTSYYQSKDASAALP